MMRTEHTDNSLFSGNAIKPIISQLWSSIHKNRMTRILTRLLFIAVIGCAIALYWTITNSSNPFGPDPKLVERLTLVMLILLLVLAVIITWRLASLWFARHRGFTGSRLQTRIIMMFSLVSMLPTIIVAVFSVLFFSQGIQSWFDKRVSTALDESVAVAEGYLREHKKNIQGDIIALANQLNREAPSLVGSYDNLLKAVSRYAGFRKLTEAVVIHNTPENRQEDEGLKFIHRGTTHTIPNDVVQDMLKGTVVLLNNEEENFVRAIVSLTSFKDTFLVVGREVDSTVLDHMERTKGSVNEYQRLRTNISNTQIEFSLIFMGVALLLLFTALWAGMIFAATLVSPIRNLIDATERVKAGDLDVRVKEGPRNDEMGMLDRAFNRMTAQLQKNRQELLEINRLTDSKRRLIEAVLSGVSAGVIALDSEKRITMFNRSAVSLLEEEDEALQNVHITNIFPEVESLLKEITHLPESLLQEEITLVRHHRKATFLVRVVREEFSDEIEGYIVTFDDITELLIAQRTAAWSDVARRIAHEIKNPLTPIRLATDRLKRKYQNDVSDQENYLKYLDTITRHVETIHTIIEEFTQFARMPSAKLEKTDLAAIIQDAVFSEKVVNKNTRFDVGIPEGELWIKADKSQLGQVFTNLLKNASEAMEDTKKPCISIQVKAGDHISVTLEDNGKGFPEELMNRLTEPYVTTREKGTGLGLAIVKKVLDDHGAKLLITNSKDKKGKVQGAQVVLIFQLYTSGKP